MAKNWPNLLRCEINRVVIAALQDPSAGADAEDMYGNQAPSPTGSVAFSFVWPVGPVDDLVLMAAVDVVGYVQTMWELITLRSLEKYIWFDRSYDVLEAFLEKPSRWTLSKNIAAITNVLSGAATLRGVPSPCPGSVMLFGLTPPDPTIKAINAPEDPDERYPLHTMRMLNKSRTVYGSFMLGTMAASLVGLSAAAVKLRR